ncbi:MAG: serine/threonine protein kinase [Polyangiaceae bacterium]|nr:serine/threonine protein kinase [Polyangiaceae bacterium]
MSDGSGASQDPSQDPLLQYVGRAPPIEPPLPLEPGQRLGRFELRERLGHGAMGVVYAAHDEVLGREVALKLVAPVGVLEETRKRLLREARSTAKVIHPGVATVHDALELGGRLVLVLELVRGRTLRRALSEAGGKLPTARAIEVMAAVARAVHAAHLAGVVHRDLKPDNVMLADSGGVKVLDFGLAAAMGDVGAEGAPSASFAGTPGYVAPEARRGKSSAPSDQFSLGVMLLECVAGARTANSRVAPLPRAVRRVIERATAARPEDRYPSCDALARAIERARPGRAVRLAVGTGAIAIGLTAFALARFGPTNINNRTVMRAPSAPALAVAVACPQLSTSKEVDGWLGAAAASLACRQIRASSGGREDRAMGPAALLNLPASPAEDFPHDPFSQPGARARAVEAAEASGRLVIDGSIAKLPDGFSVDLVVSRSGEVLAKGQGSGSLVVAVDRATAALFANGGIEPATSVDPEISKWTGIESVDVLRDLAFAEGAIRTGGGALEAIERIDRRPEAFGMHAAPLRSRLRAGLGEKDALVAPQLDATSNEAFVKTAAAHLLLGGATTPASLATQAAERRKGEPTEEGRDALLGLEALARLSAGERDEARTLALASCLDGPSDCPWSILAHASFGRPEFATLSRAYRAWVPEMADAWNIAAHVDVPESRRVELLERAYVLGDGFPLYAGNYGSWLLIGGRADEARAVAARLEMGSAGQKIAAQKLSVEIALSEGRVLAAYEASRKALRDIPRVASILTGDVALLAHYVELGVLLGRGPETARDVYERFVLPEPPRLDDGPFAKGAIAHACAYADRDVAERCFDRLAELERRGYFPLGGTGDAAGYVEGARAFALGDLPGAVRAFRRVKSDLGTRASVPGLAFERAGELDLADAIDPARTGVFAGLSQSKARAARRAHLRGDCAVAAPIASSFILAWSKADVELAIVGEMRKIKAACCRRDAACKS